MMKIALACDHGGYELKEYLKAVLERLGHSYEDFGCHTPESCDYPDFGRPAALAVANGSCERGILVCYTGIGISIVANKIHGIRCAHCTDSLQAELTRRHNDANLIALGGGFTGKAMAERIVEVFLSTDFEGGRHERRVRKVMETEQIAANQPTDAPENPAESVPENPAESVPENPAESVPENT